MLVDMLSMQKHCHAAASVSMSAMNLKLRATSDLIVPVLSASVHGTNQSLDTIALY